MPNIALDSTPQQVADFVVAHLYKQGKPAKGESTCVYRKFEDDGTYLMCAVGALLTDEEFDPWGNAWSLQTLLRKRIDMLSQDVVDFYRTHYDLLRRLQGVHDLWVTDLEGKYNFSSLILKLQRLYSDFGLSFPEILQTE